VCIVENKAYINPFENVHKKAKALKDLARETREREEELREGRALLDAEKFFDKTEKPD
jgi:RNA polymerase-interacting CarD/CdnL/TRCF family regulator